MSTYSRSPSPRPRPHIQSPFHLQSQTYPMLFNVVLAEFAFRLISWCFIVVFQELNIMTEFVYLPFLEIVSIDDFMGLQLALTYIDYIFTRATAFELGFLRTFPTTSYTLLLIFYVGRLLIKLSNLSWNQSSASIYT